MFKVGDTVKVSKRYRDYFDELFIDDAENLARYEARIGTIWVIQNIIDGAERPYAMGPDYSIYLEYLDHVPAPAGKGGKIVPETPETAQPELELSFTEVAKYDISCDGGVNWDWTSRKHDNMLECVKSAVEYVNGDKSLVKVRRQVSFVSEWHDFDPETDK